MELIKDNEYLIHLTSIPKDNACNIELIEQIAIYFKVNKYQVKIIKGLKNKKKYLLIDI